MGFLESSLWIFNCFPFTRSSHNVNKSISLVSFRVSQGYWINVCGLFHLRTDYLRKRSSSFLSLDEEEEETGLIGGGRFRLDIRHSFNFVRSWQKVIVEFALKVSEEGRNWSWQIASATPLRGREGKGRTDIQLGESAQWLCLWKWNLSLCLDRKITVPIKIIATIYWV